MRRISFSVQENFKSILEHTASDCLIVIDIPIGLPDDQPRVCDQQARTLLGWPRRNSVFSPPARSALCATSYKDAKRLNVEALGVSLTKQSYCIVPKICDVDRMMSAEKQGYIREAHPEVTFARLQGSAMRYKKSARQGRAERLQVLQAAAIEVSESWLSAERTRLGPSCVAFDDLIDALACLITAAHIHQERSESLGDPAQRDARRLQMEIVTCAVATKGATA
jgi:predicted RNase H-like nuclease